MNVNLNLSTSLLYDLSLQICLEIKWIRIEDAHK